MYGIAYTCTTQNYMKVDTPCENKFKMFEELQVILPDIYIMQATHREELNPIPLLSTRGKHHTFPPPSNQGY